MLIMCFYLCISVSKSLVFSLLDFLKKIKNLFLAIFVSKRNCDCDFKMPFLFFAMVKLRKMSV